MPRFVTQGSCKKFFYTIYRLATIRPLRTTNGQTVDNRTNSSTVIYVWSAKNADALNSKLKNKGKNTET